MRRPSRARRICQLWIWGGSFTLLVCAMPLFAGAESAQAVADAARKIFKPQVPIRVVLPDASAHEIIGTASLEFSDGSRLARAASLTIQAGQQQTSQTGPPILKQSRDHENVIEFKAE